MTLVRVYCGLASAESAVVTTDAQAWLTVAVVDDSGRLVDICEISDDPGGYAELCALFAQRGAGSGGVAIATQGNDHVVTRLLAAAGRYLSLSDESSVDDFAERFADDESPEEMRSGRAERRAVGLARALQAGVLSAVPQPPPEELLSLKPLLAAHDAVVTGRRSAAGTLRDVLRELYPAALRAYADPAEPVPLAVLDALPEPGQLAAGRTQETHIVAQLVEAGVAERATVAEAVTALRVAISETPRRAGMTRAMTSAVAESVRQTVASVRACDAAAESMVEVIADRMADAAVPAGEVAGPTPLRVVPDDGRQPGGRRRGVAAASAAALAPPTDRPAERGATFGGLRPAEPAPVPAQPAAAFPSRTGEHRTVPPQQAPGFGPRTGEHRTVPAQPAAGFASRTGEHRTVAPQQAPGFGSRTGEHGTVPAQPSGLPSRSGPTVIPASSRRPQGRPDADQPAASASVPAQSPPAEAPSPLEQAVRRATGGGPMPAPMPTRGQAAPPPSVSAEYPMVGHLPPGGQLPPASAPPSGPRRPPFTRAEPTLYTTGEYSRLAASFDRESGDSTNGGGPAPAPRQSPEARPVVPARPPVEPPQLSPEVPAPGSRATWPNVGEAGQQQAEPEPVRNGATDVPRLVDLPRQREGRVVPPWQSDDLPAEPPTLRLVEPAPLADPALSSLPPDSRLDPPALRLVEPDPPPMRANGSRSAGADLLGDAPVDASAMDDDLLIFSECRSAWFTDPTEEAEDDIEWATAADLGWQAAEQAARPAVGAETGAGLPKRVPQENLVPGSPIPPPEQRPLRIVRDAASIAAHTSGYFSGYRRGQEVGGFSVGGRPGRESSTGWDFAREASNSQQFSANGGQDEYEYRSARR